MKEQMEYEDLWNKKREENARKPLRETYEIWMEMHRENPEKYTRELVLKAMDMKAKKLGVKNFHEKMYKEGYLFNVLWDLSLGKFVESG